MKARGHRPLVLVDVASPRDVDPAASRLDNLFLYDLDALEQIVEQNRAARSTAIPRAERIIEEELDFFFDWYKSLAVTPMIKACATPSKKSAGASFTSTPSTSSVPIGRCSSGTRAPSSASCCTIPPFASRTSIVLLPTASPSSPRFAICSNFLKLIRPTHQMSLTIRDGHDRTVGAYSNRHAPL